MSDNWQNKRVTVMGLGRFAGGVSATRWLAARGARVTVSDAAPAEKLAASIADLAGVEVQLHLGRHEPTDFTDADLIVVNPAVKPTSEFLTLAHDAGVPITTEINLFVERCPARTVGVTGSVGKSTVTAMIGHVLEHAAQAGARPAIRRVWVGGNIGASLLAALDDITAEDVVVLELSSFQLERTPAVAWSPHVALITNVTPNHIDWHGSFAAYRDAKLNIGRFQRAERDRLILPLDDATVAGDVGAMPAAVTRFGLDGHGVPVLRDAAGAARQVAELMLDVPGRHNRLNAAAALAAADAIGVELDAARMALATFQALPHRLQRVAEQGGITYYDDSKSTTPEAALTALAAFEGRPLLLVLGGYDKGSDLKPLAAAVAQQAKLAACIGVTGAVIADAIRAAGGRSEYCETLDRAVRTLQQQATPGDVMLLSPACASWDQFPDYRVRGETFARLVREAR